MSATKSSVDVTMRPPVMSNGIRRCSWCEVRGTWCVTGDRVGYACSHARRTTHHAPSWQLPHHVVVALGAAVAEELPGATHLLDHVEVHLRHDQLVLVLAPGGEERAA